MKEVNVVARYYANGERITDEDFSNIIFSNFLIDRIIFTVNQRLCLGP